MKKADQKQFIKDVCEGLQQRLLEKLPKLPEEWNGIELRQFIIDSLEDGWGFNPYGKKAYKKQLKDYRNTVIVKGLI